MRKITAFFIISLSACGGLANTSENLSGGFVYSDMGGDYKTIHTGFPNQKSILGTVKEYSYNEDFILALQYPNILIHKLSISSALQVKKARMSNIKSSYNIRESDDSADSIIRNDPYYKKIFSHKKNYWIISIKNQTIYGPMSNIEYLKKHKILKIPKYMQLEKI